MESAENVSRAIDEKQFFWIARQGVFRHELFHLLKKVFALSRVFGLCATALAYSHAFGQEDLSDASQPSDLKVEKVYAQKGLQLSDGSRWFLRRLHIPDPEGALKNLVGQRVSFGPSLQNRYGEHIGNLFLDDGSWLQEILLRQGQALLDPVVPDEQGFLQDYQRLMKAEQEAEQKALGLWQNPSAFVYQATDLEREPFGQRGRFIIVEGTINDTATRTVNRSPILFINFGENYREDFTIVVQPPVLRSFRQRLRQLKIKQASMKGQPVRMRGILGLSNGPSIDLQHPDALEFLGAFDQ